MILRSSYLLYIAFTIIALIQPFFIGCTPKSADSVVECIVVHINDVYEIGPVAHGTEGGLARVAALCDSLRRENANTFVMLAGDLFSPSAMGTAPVDGEPLAGRQMVATLNALPLDFCTFGNHEFDLKKDAFDKRLDESQFLWISGNVRNAAGAALPGVADHHIFNVSNGAGDTMRIAILATTLDEYQPDYVRIADPIASARKQARALRDSADALIALTHLSLAQDITLAQTTPEIDIVMGGHEHENMFVYRGRDLTPICKADANARTVFIHRLRFHTTTQRLDIQSHLQIIDERMPADTAVERIVRDWTDRAYAGFRSEGFEPERVVAQTPIPLDGREASVRNRSTKLTELIAGSMLTALPQAELSIFNSGSIRIDDVLPPGPITEYDVIRIMPFGGAIVLAEIRGADLQRALDAGQDNKGSGGYLQTAGVDRQNGWLIGGAPLNLQRVYKIAINDFLLTGKESGLEFLQTLDKLRQGPDMRNALIDQLHIDFPT